MPTEVKCAFCGRPKNEVKKLVAAKRDDVFICNRCIGDAAAAIGSTKDDPKAKKDEPLRKPSEIKAFLDQHVISQEKAKTDVAVAVYNHFKRREALKKGMTFDCEIQKSNIMLMGPSGTGKTEIARAIAKLLKVPFYVADATRLTMSGYVGDDVESLLQGLLQDANGDPEAAGWGIVFIDEFDKLARKSGRSASGHRDITGEGVQQALLKLLEGSKVVVPRGMGKGVVATTIKADGSVASSADVVDTTNILFICAGSFAGIDETVSQRVNKKAAMGFGAEHRQKLEANDIYLQITEDDVLDFGIIPELMGRVPVITTTLSLTDADMIRVLQEPKNAILKQFKALFQMDGVDLQFDEAALVAIAKEAKRRPTGARSLRAILEMTLRKACFEVPNDPTIKVVRVTEESVGGKADPVYTRVEGETVVAAAEAAG